MPNFLSTLINWIMNFWGKIPADAKEEIINTIVETFDEAFRSFYKSKTQR